ncbi:MAG TPA: MDR family MFS transporter [Candidatus Dormibacteraeota bacterium]|nr:MDR family MFS transporter [Candidatus Dormibacteraeota bacterium]
MTVSVSRASGALTPAEHHRIMRLMSGLILSLLAVSVSQTILTTALPTIVGQLGGQDQLGWLASGQLLATTVSMPLWGKLSDIHGRKRLFQLSLVIFVVGSLLAAVAPGIAVLVAARAVQGIGSGGAVALTQAILADELSPRHRGRYSGYLGASFALATVCGPLIGGFLVVEGTVGWRLCFLVGLPLVVAAMVVVHSTLENAPPRIRQPLDRSGALLISAGIVCAGLVLSLGGTSLPWLSPWTLALGALVVVLLAGAVRQERRAVDPVLPPRLLQVRTFRLAGLALLVSGVVMYGALTYLPLYLQIVKDRAPTVAGLLTLPMVVTMVGSSALVGRRVSAHGRYKRYPLIGMALAAVGLLMLGQLGADSSLLVVGAGMALVGTGVGMSGQMLIVACQNEAEQRDLGVVSSTTSFLRSLGGALGVALLGSVLASQLSSIVPALLRSRHVAGAASVPLEKLLGTPAAVAHLPAGVRGAVVDGLAQSLDAVFLAMVPLCLIGLFAVWRLRELPLRTSRLEPAWVAAEAVAGPELAMEATA